MEEEGSRFAREDEPIDLDALSRLREAVNDEPDGMYDYLCGGEDIEWLLERFFRSRNGDVQAALGMIRKYAEWKKEYTPATHNSRMRYRQLGILHRLQTRDRWKRPVLYYIAERHNPSLDHIWILNCAEAMLRELMEQVKGNEPSHRKLVGIIDLRNFSRRHIDFKLVKAGIPFAQDLFPHLIGSIVIINSGWLISGLWSVVRPWLDPHTREKIVFASGEALNDILDEMFVDRTILPSDLGGDGEAIPPPNVDAFAKDAMEQINETSFDV